MHNKTPRPKRRIRTARSHFKTRSENKTRRIRALQDAKTYKTHSKGTLPFQDAFRKTRQDVFVHNKTPRPKRRIRTARSHFKTRSENTTRRICALQDAMTYKTHSKGTLPFQDAFRKTRQDVFVHNRTPRPKRRIRTARSHFKTRSENKTRRIRALPDAKTYKTHSKARSHFKTRSEKQDKTYSFITRRQDQQDAFDRHAPISRRVGKNKTRRIRA